MGPGPQLGSLNGRRFHEAGVLPSQPIDRLQPYSLQGPVEEWLAWLRDQKLLKTVKQCFF